MEKTKPKNLRKVEIVGTIGQLLRQDLQDEQDNSNRPATKFLLVRHSQGQWSLLKDLSERVTNRFQLSTDGNKMYLTAVEEAF